MPGADIELATMPSASTFARDAVLGTLRRSRPAELDGKTTVVRGVRADVSHLASYNRVCGFRLTDTLPPTYLHVMAFPLAMGVMTAQTFPFAALGLIHVANAITIHRPIRLGESLDFAAHAADLRPHERGRQFDLIVTAEVDGVEVWRDVSTYLRRAPSSEPRPASVASTPPSPPEGEPTVTWQVDRGTGTAYGRVSGDRNPIHTSLLGAKAFGFPGPIAHGMWTMARSLASLEGRLPSGYRVEVAFKRPIPLPSTVGQWTAAQDGGWDLDVVGLSRATPHMTGTIRPLTDARRPATSGTPVL